jgi:hypothetical protein
VAGAIAIEITVPPLGPMLTDSGPCARAELALPRQDRNVMARKIALHCRKLRTTLGAMPWSSVVFSGRALHLAGRLPVST